MWIAKNRVRQCWGHLISKLVWVVTDFWLHTPSSKSLILSLVLAAELQQALLI